MPQLALAGGKGRGKLVLYEVADPTASAIAALIDEGVSPKKARKQVVAANEKTSAT